MPPASRGGRSILTVLSLLCAFFCATSEGRLLKLPRLLSIPVIQNREFALGKQAEQHDTLGFLGDPHFDRTSQGKGKSTDASPHEGPQLNTSSTTQRSAQADKRSLRQKLEYQNLHGGSPGNIKRRSELGQTFGLFPYLPALFAFGDSDFDLGNTLYLNVTPYKATKYAPYGESYKGGDALRGRFCDGLLVPDFLAEGLGLPILPPNFAPNASFSHGTSFAVSGSGLLNATRNMHNPAIKTHLFAQVENFLAFQEASIDYWAQHADNPPLAPQYPPPSAFAKALYMVLVGANDVLKFMVVQHGKPGPAADVFVEEMTAMYGQFVKAIYAAGGRNFVLFSLGNIGCSPLARQINNGTCSPTVSSICSSLAAATAALPARLAASVPDARILVGDMFGFNREVEGDPSRFGVTNIVDACCGGGVPGLGNTYTTCADEKPATVNGVTYPRKVCSNPGTYQFWDQFHLTQAMNRQLSHEVLRGSSWVYPGNILKTFVVPQIESTYGVAP